MTVKQVKRAFRYRFYPTSQQEVLLRKTFGCVRLVYNKALAIRSEAWRLHRTSVTYGELSAMLPVWKKQEDLAFLKEISSVPLQQELRHLQTAFTKFWNKQGGYPKFKSKRHSKLSATFTGSAFKCVDNKLYIAKSPEPLDIHWSRELPENVTPSSITVMLDKAGRWFVSILVEDNIEELPEIDSSIGIDLGLSTLMTLSTGEKIKRREISPKQRESLRRCQQDLSRKVKNSKNWEKNRLKLAKKHAKISDSRRDFLHKLSTQLIRENQTIVTEDLNIKGMSAKGGSYKKGLNRSIMESSWSELISMLTYKASWYGRELIQIDRWFPSTRMCGSCSQLTGPHGRKELSIRYWTCSNCGAAHNRDVNAANNILAAGLAVTVCGDGRRRTAVG